MNEGNRVSFPAKDQNTRRDYCAKSVLRTRFEKTSTMRWPGHDGYREIVEIETPLERNLTFHLTSVWLFTFSDLKTIVGPKSLFGILNAVAAPVFEVNTNSPMSFRAIFLTAFWVWINLAPFVIDNQRRAKSILEDKQNKPWRPLPSKRITQREARTLMLFLYPVALITSLLLGGCKQTCALIILGYWYNSLGGSGGMLSKNFINACGFVCFASGAMEVALGKSLPCSSVLVGWLMVIWGVVFTTVQIQDLPDQEGDLLCGRNTLPLALGDFYARCFTALFMVVWSFVCPFYWHPLIYVHGIFVPLGILIAIRTLFWRGVDKDTTTFWLWNGWMMILYSIPLTSYLLQF